MSKWETINLKEKQVKKAESIYNHKDAQVWRDYDSALENLKDNKHDLDSVIIKAAAIDKLYGTWVFDIHPVSKKLAEYITENGVGNIDYSLVEELAEVEFEDDKTWIFRSFTSKYLHFFVNEEKFPIYDSFSGIALSLHCGYGRSHYDGRKYNEFFEDIDKLRRESEMPRISFRELDRYLWLCGQYDVYWRHNPKEKAPINRYIKKIFLKEELRLDKVFKLREE